MGNTLVVENVLVVIRIVLHVRIVAFVLDVVVNYIYCLVNV